jgi:hypothetical protein
MKTSTLCRVARKTLFNLEQNTEVVNTICIMKDTGVGLIDSPGFSQAETPDRQSVRRLSYTLVCTLKDRV